MSSNPNSLSREVLRWVQSLDLAYSIKNPKRDFSNGFLIAEIFSRYFVRGISMHGFDNGTAIRVKKDNWGQLLKFFRKQGLDIITDDEVTAIIHCEEGSVCQFIRRIYQALTQREVQEVVKRPPTERPPAYMRNTGSKVVKDKLRTGNFTEHPDEKATGAALQAELATHEAELQLEKSIDPERFSSLSLSGSRVAHVSRTMGEVEEPVPQVTVERIEVKQSDKNIAHLRAVQDPMAAKMNVARAAAMQGQAGGSAAAADDLDLGSAFGASVQDIFDRATSDSSAFASSGDLVKALLDGEESAVKSSGSFFRSLSESSAKIAGTCVQNPNDFWVVSSTFCPLMTDLPRASSAFAGAVGTFSEIGAKIAKARATAVGTLFANYSLGAICDIIKAQPSKRPAALSTLYAYTAPDANAHLVAIEKLRDELGDDEVSFLNSLIGLVFMEDSSRFDASLADIYLYHAVIGLGQPIPSIRSGSLAMMAEVFAKTGTREVGQFLEPLLKLAEEDTFWESKAQLLIVSSVVLRSEGATDEIKDAFFSIISKTFHPKAHGNIKRVGIAYLAPVLPHMNALLPLFLEVLLGMSAFDRIALMGLGAAGAATSGDDKNTSELSLRGARDLSYVIHKMPGLDVATGLLDVVTSNSVFYEEHAQVLLGCIQAAHDLSGNMWLDVWDGFKSVLSDSLVVEGVSEVAGDVIFALLSRNDQVADGVCGGVLNSLFDEVFGEGGSDKCKENFLILLTRIANFSEGGRSYVESLLAEGSATVAGDDDLLNLQDDLAR